MAEYEEEGQIIRLEWTCTSCETRNSGGTRLCKGCGAPMGNQESFKLAAEDQAVTDAAELEQARRGPDVHCGYCQARNPGGAKQCTQCGAPMDAGEARSSGRDLNQATVTPPPTEEQATTSWSGTLRKVALAAAVVLAVLFLGRYYLTREHDAAMTVGTVAWSTELQYEEYKTVTRDGWKGELPPGARVLASEQRVHHRVDIKIGERDEQVTERVQVGTTKRLKRVEKRDQGNGYAKEVKIYEDEPRYEDRRVTRRVDVTSPSPVYDRWCHYQAEVWEAASAKLSGTDNSVRWPEVKSTVQMREKARVGSFVVTFGQGRSTCSYKAPNEQDFARFRPGTAWKVRVNNMGVVTKVL